MPPELGKGELTAVTISSLCGFAFSIWLIISSIYANGTVKYLETAVGVILGTVTAHIALVAIATVFNVRDDQR
jgi:hypothetical protein